MISPLYQLNGELSLSFAIKAEGVVWISAGKKEGCLGNKKAGWVIENPPAFSIERLIEFVCRFQTNV